MSKEYNGTKINTRRKNGTAYIWVVYLSLFILVIAITSFIYLFCFSKLEFNHLPLADQTTLITMCVVSIIAPILFILRTLMGENHRYQQREEWMLSGEEFKILNEKKKFLEEQIEKEKGATGWIARKDYNDRLNEVFEIMDYLSSHEPRISSDLTNKKVKETSVNSLKKIKNSIVKIQKNFKMNSKDEWINEYFPERIYDMLIRYLKLDVKGYDKNSHYINSYINRKAGLLMLSFTNVSGRVRWKNDIANINLNSMDNFDRKFYLVDIKNLAKSENTHNSIFNSIMHFIDFDDFDFVERIFKEDENLNINKRKINLDKRIELLNFAFVNHAEISFEQYIQNIESTSDKGWWFLRDFLNIFKEKERKNLNNLLTLSFDENFNKNYDPIEMLSDISKRSSFTSNKIEGYILREILNKEEYKTPINHSKEFYTKKYNKILKKNPVFESELLDDFKKIATSTYYLISDFDEYDWTSNDILVYSNYLERIEFNYKELILEIEKFNTTTS